MDTSARNNGQAAIIARLCSADTCQETAVIEWNSIKNVANVTNTNLWYCGGKDYYRDARFLILDD